MVILVNTLSILLPVTVLENCLKTPGLNLFIGIFSDRETLELLTVSLSFEDLLPHLTFTCFCFICGTFALVFIYDYRKCCRFSEPYFLYSSPVSMCGLPPMSFNFPVELSHLILCSCHTMLFH